MIHDWTIEREGEYFRLVHRELLVTLHGPFLKGDYDRHIFGSSTAFGGHAPPEMISPTFPEAKFYGQLVYLTDADLAMIKLAAE